MYSFTLDGKKVHLIDTPGFDDTSRTDTEVLTTLAVWLSASYQHNFKLDSILYLQRITDLRMSGSSLKNLRIFKDICGSGSLSSVVLVTTMWDRFNDEEIIAATKREEELVSNPEFWGSMIRQGSLTYRHFGTRESASHIVSSIIAKTTTTVLQIQTELVDEGKTLSETRAGQGLNKELVELKKMYEKELRELQAETKEAIAQKDEQSAKLLAIEQLGSERKVEKIEKERRALLDHRTKVLLSEKEKEVKAMKEKHQQETTRLREEVAEKEGKIRSLQAACMYQTFPPIWRLNILTTI